MPEKPSLFISYATEHEKHAAFLKTRIEDLFQGAIRLFLAGDPGSIAPGETWFDEVLSEIQGADALLVLLSPSVITRPWVSFEVGAGTSLDKKIFPLRYGSLGDEDLPSTLAHLQTLDLTKANGVQQLLLGLPGALRPTPEVAATAAQEISDYFKTVRPDDWVRLFMPSANLRLRFLGNLSTSQYGLLHAVSRLETQHTQGDRKSGWVSRGVVRERHPISREVEIDGRPEKRLASDSEYYYRLRELYFLGLLDMKVGHTPDTNLWRVRPDIRYQLFQNMAP